GMFALAPLCAGATVIVWGGWVCTSADVAAGRVAPRSTVYIGEDTFLGARAGEYDRERDDRGDFINHSCDPNVWLADENTLVARRRACTRRGRPPCARLARRGPGACGRPASWRPVWRRRRVGRGPPPGALRGRRRATP